MTRSKSPERVDVVIVGAGLSGIAAAHELQRSCPDRTFALLEMRESIGGTWDLFRYPGVRSDSDMYTLGYVFRPWSDVKAIASGESILDYLRETVDELGLWPYLRLGTRVVTASWDSDDAEWTLSVETAEGTSTVRCSFLYMAAGYYSYAGGFDPPLTGEDRFEGRIVHPQAWPDGLDYTDQRVAVIGSGATAVTLVPSMAGSAERVTLVQRSPGYLAIESDVDAEANELRGRVGAQAAFETVRLRNLQNQQELYQLARADPQTYKKALFAAIDEIVGEEVRVRHFTPDYEPWDQRVCFVPNGDLFHAIRDGDVDVVTGVIDTLTETGLLMQDGTVVEADLIVKATGLNLAVAGEAEVFVDGERIDFSQCLTYKGLAYSGVPNLVTAFGFLNSSWTLRLELVNRAWVAIMRRMEEIGASRVTPTLRPGDIDGPVRPFLEDVASGYFTRALPAMPRQGARAPWTNPQNYVETKALLEQDPQDGVLVFEAIGSS